MNVEGELFVKLGARTYVPVTMNTFDVDKLQSDLLVMCHAVNSRHVYVMENNYICEYCGCMDDEVKNIEHRPDCVVLKARDIIKEIK